MATYIRKYDSICQFAQYIDSLPEESRGKDTSKRRVDKGWDMGVSFKQALNVALDGGNWQEGAEQLQSVSIDKAAHELAEVIEPAIIHDVCGGGLDIGEYLADSPECFFRLEDVEVVRPIVKIGVCNVPCANIEAHQMMNHGRAIIALVEALELQGYSVELSALFISRASGDVFISDTAIKQAGEPWSAASVAYALAHPAFPRRLGFRELEEDKDCYKMTWQGYGDGRIEKPEGYDLYFKYLDTPYNVDTPADALEYVKEIATKQQPQLLQGA